MLFCAPPPNITQNQPNITFYFKYNCKSVSIYDIIVLNKIRKEEDKMKCPNCNAENENNSKFCTSCGSPIPQPTAQGSSYEGAQYPPQAQNQYVPVGSSEAQRRKAHLISNSSHNINRLNRLNNSSINRHLFLPFSRIKFNRRQTQATVMTASLKSKRAKKA